MAAFFLVLVFAGLATSSPVPFDDQISVEEVTFQLYTKTNSEEGVRIATGDVDTLPQGGFDPTLPVKIIVHGWMDHVDGVAIQILKREFLRLEPMNVIGVGWSPCSTNVLYEEDIICAQQVGQYIGELVVWLGIVAGVQAKDVHLLGHSLGGQVVGYASQVVKVGHITALDPAAPLFTHSSPDHRLDESDADFVEVFHTSIKLLGFRERAGHLDFYANWGSVQPGCGGIFGACAHYAAYYYYAHTINPSNREEYMAYQCSSIEEAVNTTCTGEPMQIMGYGVNTELRGIFYSNITTIPYNEY